MRSDVEIGGVGFVAVEPRDAAMFRRGGVIIWARRRWGGLRPISVQEAQVISATASFRPPEADTLLISPPITDGRRRREVLKTVQSALWTAQALAAE
jgi:hypothetical protein